MLKKISLAAIATIVCLASSFAQTDTTMRVKKVNHYVGVQVNELIRQIFNFNDNNNTVIDNPYLLKYSLSFAKGKWAPHTALGYRFNSIEVEESNNKTTQNDVFYRVGMMRKSMLGKRVEVGYGLDYAGEYANRTTVSISVIESFFSVDSTYAKFTQKTSAHGGGPHLELSFYITPYLLIGTETNYYFLKSVDRENFLISETVYDPFTGEISLASISNENEKTQRQEFAITVPVAIFLTVKF
jgi:hypothetical protein